MKFVLAFHVDGGSEQLALDEETDGAISHGASVENYRPNFATNQLTFGCVHLKCWSGWISS
jgi:hypothetical protein